jgi:hypothetical protein
MSIFANNTVVYGRRPAAARLRFGPARSFHNETDTNDEVWPSSDSLQNRQRLQATKTTRCWFIRDLKTLESRRTYNLGSQTHK